MVINSIYLPDKPYDRAHNSDTRNIKAEDDLFSPTDGLLTGTTSRTANLSIALTLWPLITHGILVAFTTSFMIFYLGEKSFNLEQRQPYIELADGSRFRVPEWTPLQSDVTTFISILLAIIRLVVAAWVGPLYWRCAFILMETTGLKADQLYRMISYNIPSLPQTRLLQLTLWVALALSLPVYLVAPVLTGSVTWVPFHIIVSPPPGYLVSVRDSTLGSQWSGWALDGFWRHRTSQQAVGFAHIAWGRGSPDASSKRVVTDAVNLRINSTINNITLPYFRVSAIEWISNPEQVLTPTQLDVRHEVCKNVTLYQTSLCPLILMPGAMGFMQRESWDGKVLPSASMVEDTRLLALYGGWRNSNTTTCALEHLDEILTDLIPEKATFYPAAPSNECWLFARVTFTAGVGSCIDCRISSNATVQADSTNPLQDLRGDPMALPALNMIPTIVSSLVVMNASVPSAWNRVEGFVVDMLERSYSVSWAAITNFVGERDPKLLTSYRVAWPASRARIDVKRVCLWSGIQFFITISGILFLVAQVGLKTPMMRDTTLAAFYLDSSGLNEPESYQRLQQGALITLRYEDGHMKVKVR